MFDHWINFEFSMKCIISVMKGELKTLNQLFLYKGIAQVSKHLATVPTLPAGLISKHLKYMLWQTANHQICKIFTFNTVLYQ